MPMDSASHASDPTLMIVDDHPVVRAGLRAMLEQSGGFKVVVDVGDGEEALAAWQRFRPEIALVDLGLPGMDGFALVAELCRRDPSARVAIMTALAGENDVHQAVHAGAMGYVLKDADRSELVECLRTVARGKRYLQGSVANQLANSLHPDRPTPRELAVLKGMAMGRSNKEIAAQLSIGEGTIKTHVRSLLLKFGAKTRTEAVRFGMQRGFVRV